MRTDPLDQVRAAMISEIESGVPLRQIGRETGQSTDRLLDFRDGNVDPRWSMVLIMMQRYRFRLSGGPRTK